MHLNEKRNLKLIIYTLVIWGTLNSTIAFCQANTASLLDSSKIKQRDLAISSAIAFLNSKFLNKEVSSHFIADSNFSMIVCEDYKTFFNTNVHCKPKGYDISFHVVLSNKKMFDTIYSNIFIPLDSSYTVQSDMLADMNYNDMLTIWEKIILNKYMFNYSDVRQFIKQKGLKNYSIDIMKETNKRKQNALFYWIVTCDSKDDRATGVLYSINPNTGQIKRKILPKERKIEIAY